MNWEELKKFCNELPEEELKKKVILWREGECINDMDATQLTEDHYQTDGDDGCYPLGEADLH